MKYDPINEVFIDDCYTIYLHNIKNKIKLPIIMVEDDDGT